MTPAVRFSVNFASGILTALMALFSLIVSVGLMTFWINPLPPSQVAAFVGVILMPLAAGMALFLYRSTRPAVALLAILGLLAADLLLIAHANRFF